MPKEPKPRTSLTLTARLVKEARHVALEERRSLSAMVEELLERYVKANARKK